MNRLAFLAGVLTAQAAWAADDCGLTADQVKAVPQALVGTWNGVFRDGMAVQDGKPQALPADATVQKIVLTLDGGKLTLAVDDMFPAIAFDPVADVQDYALPGESPLAAAEFLAPEVTAAGLTCDPASLPQVQGTSTVDSDVTSTFRIIGLTPDQVVLVIRGSGHGLAARAVFDLTRAAKG